MDYLQVLNLHRQLCSINYYNSFICCVIQAWSFNRSNRRLHMNGQARPKDEEDKDDQV